MNLITERNKPIFVARARSIQFCNANDVLTEALANSTALHASAVDDEIMVKASAARKLPRQTLLTVDDATLSEVKELVISRFRIDSTEKFEFLDGRTFSGAEAANQVREESEIGKYFLELEKENLRILQDAFRKGQI